MKEAASAVSSVGLLHEAKQQSSKVVDEFVEVTTIRRTGTTLFFEMHVLDALASIDFFFSKTAPSQAYFLKKKIQ